MLCNTEAIVLNTYQYGETSLICNLFSKDYGKLSIISKGARTIKNPNRAILQTLHYIDLVYYYKPKRNMQLLKEVAINNHFFQIKKNYKKIIYSYAIIDILNHTSQINNACNIIFRLAKITLEKINYSPIQYIDLYFIFYQLQLLKYLGFQPAIKGCCQCHQKSSIYYYCQRHGQLVCKNCNNNSTIIIKSLSLSIINLLMYTHINKITFIEYNSSNIKEIKSFLLYYFSYHIINIQTIKSFKLIKI